MQGTREQIGCYVVSAKRAENGSDQNDGVESHFEFETFVLENEQLFQNFVARIVSNTNIEADDALQEGLERIWAEWAHWPENDGVRIRYALRALQVSTLDTVRRQHGRSGNRPQNILVDFSSNKDNGRTGLNVHALASFKKILNSTQANARDDDSVLNRSAIAEACKALKPLELKILIKVGLLGFSYKEVANRLNINTDKVAELYYETRHILRQLISHANSMGEIPERDKKQLKLLIQGDLIGRELRIALRHYEHCETCKKIVR